MASKLTNWLAPLFCTLILISKFGHVQLVQIRFDDDIDDEIDIEMADNDKIQTQKSSKKESAESENIVKIRQMKKPTINLNIPIDRLPEYRVELFFIALSVTILSTYIIGTNINIKIAKEWTTKYSNVIIPHFDHCGNTGLDSNKLVQIDDNKFIFWCTGNKICKGMLLELDLFPRQSLINVIISIFFTKDFKDRLKFTVYLNENIEVPILIVGDKKAVNKNENLKAHAQFCKNRPIDAILKGVDISANDFIALSELNEFYTAISKESFGKLVRVYLNNIEYILTTDIKYDSIDKEFTMSLVNESDTSLGSKMLIAQLQFPCGIMDSDFPSAVNLEEYFQLWFKFLDHFSANKYSICKEGKSKLTKTRAGILAKIQKKEHQLRVEKAMQRKDQKVREENEKIMNTANPNIQMKLQAKKDKRIQKQTQKKQAKSVRIMG